MDSTSVRTARFQKHTTGIALHSFLFCRSWLGKVGGASQDGAVSTCQGTVSQRPPPTLPSPLPPFSAPGVQPWLARYSAPTLGTKGTRRLPAFAPPCYRSICTIGGGGGAVYAHGERDEGAGGRGERRSPARLGNALFRTSDVAYSKFSCTLTVHALQ